MMRPHFRARIPGSTACVIRNTLERHTAGVVHEDIHGTETSFDRGDQGNDIRAFGDITLRDERLPAQRADGIGRRARIRLAADVVHRDITPGPGQREGDRLANAPAATGEEGSFA